MTIDEWISVLEESKLPQDQHNELVFALMDEFRDGRPIGDARALLHSPDQRVHSIACFLAAEWGPSAVCLLPDAARWLEHHHPIVRGDVIEFVRRCGKAIEIDVELLARAVASLTHPEQRPRREVVDLLAYLAMPQIQRLADESALIYDLEVRRAVEWIATPSSGVEEVVVDMSRSPTSVLQLASLAAALRLATALQPQALRKLASSPVDTQCREFARFELPRFERKLVRAQRDQSRIDDE